MIQEWHLPHGADPGSVIYEIIWSVVERNNIEDGPTVARRYGQRP